MKTVLIFILSIHFAYGQCVFTENRTDEFTGSKVLAIEAKNVGRVGSFATYTILSIDSLVSLFVKFADMVPCSVVMGDRIYLKTQDSVIVLIATGLGNSEYNMAAKVYESSAQYDITKEQLEYLKDHPVLKVRIDHSNGYRTLFWKEKSTAFQDMIKCFLAEFLKI